MSLNLDTITFGKYKNGTLQQVLKDRPYSFTNITINLILNYIIYSIHIHSYYIILLQYYSFNSIYLRKRK